MISLSARRVGPVNTYTLTHHSFEQAVWRVLRRLPERPDALYGHFLYPAGGSAVEAGCRIGRPGFVAVGEGNFWTIRHAGIRRARRDFLFMAGAIAVSQCLRQRLIDEVGFPPDKVAVFPNGVDPRKFYPRDRLAMRRKYGLPQNQFLVAYVGNFIEPKGVGRLAEAIHGLQGVAGIFIGSGPLVPRIPNLAFCGRVPHEDVPELLSAADCFVLPSDVEGSSNATLEAMACGLPIIVSEGHFNDDLFMTPVGLRIPPLDVKALQQMVMRLRDDRELLKRCGLAALAASADRDIRQRAIRVLEWMKSRAAVWQWL